MLISRGTRSEYGLTRIISMDFLRHLSEQSQGNILIFKMTSAEAAIFADGLPAAFRDCYLDDQSIANALHGGIGTTRRDVILSAIPDNPSVASGDFGEVMSYLLLKSRHATRDVDGPKKWRWKTDRNKPAPHTDVVLFSATHPPSPTDCVIAAESKSRATSASQLQFLNALSGAKKDKTSRLAKTLVWFREKAIRTGDGELLRKMKRFIDAPESGNGPYLKEFKAVLVTDSTLQDEEITTFNQAAPDLDGIEVIVISIPDMRSFYDHLFGDVAAS